MAQSEGSISDVIVVEAPPSPSDAEGGNKRTTRKREREVSVEPSLSENKEASDRVDPSGRSARVKKNRTSGLLDVTGSGSDEDSGSPPRDSDIVGPQPSPMGPKVKMIGQKVKDLNWKDDSERLSSSPPKDLSNATTIEQAVGKGAEAIGEDNVDDLAKDPPESKQISVEADVDTPKSASPVSPPIPAEVSTAQKLAEASVESIPDTENDEVPELPSAASQEEQPIPRPPTDKSLKRKSRDSTFFAAEGYPPTEPHKRQKDDPQIIKSGSSDDVRKTPGTPPRAKSPPPANKFNGFASYSAGPSPFLKTASGSKSFLDDTPSSSSKLNAFTSFGISNFANSKLVSSFTPKSPARSTSPSPKPTFGSSPGFVSFASKPSPFLNSAAAGGSPPPDAVRGASPPISVFGASNSLKGLAHPAPKGSIPKPNEAFGGFSTGFAKFGGSTGTFGLGSKPASSSSSSPKAALKEKAPGQEKVPEDQRDGEEEVNSSDLKDEGPEDVEKKPKKKTSFSEILAADTGGDEDDSKVKVSNLEAIDLYTGEEHETTLQQFRAKLYTLDSNDAYKERGIGSLKLNVRKEDGRGARLIMRADGVLRLLMNASLFNGMPVAIATDPKFIKLSTIENGAFVHHAIKVGNPKHAQILVDLIQENIPEPPASSSSSARSPLPGVAV